MRLEEPQIFVDVARNLRKQVRAAGIAELVRPGRNGLVFDPDAPGALASAMAGLVGEDAAKTRTALGREGYVTAKRCFLDAAVQGERRLLARAVEA